MASSAGRATELLGSQEGPDECARFACKTGSCEARCAVLVLKLSLLEDYSGAFVAKFDDLAAAGLD